MNEVGLILQEPAESGSKCFSCGIPVNLEGLGGSGIHNVDLDKVGMDIAQSYPEQIELLTHPSGSIGARWRHIGGDMKLNDEKWYMLDAIVRLKSALIRYWSIGPTQIYMAESPLIVKRTKTSLGMYTIPQFPESWEAVEQLVYATDPSTTLSYASAYLNHPHGLGKNREPGVVINWLQRQVGSHPAAKAYYYGGTYKKDKFQPFGKNLELVDSIANEMGWH
jgi:hypothetical protein